MTSPPYSGQTQNRQELEDRLRANQVKALVATSALGMGYDKPDLAFCLHLGSPASPVAYYQQVGRAGRALDDATAVLVPSEADERIWDYFATAGIPVEDRSSRSWTCWPTEPQSLPALENATGIRRGRLETVLKILAVDDAVTRQGSGWVSHRQGLVLRRGEVGRAAEGPSHRGRPDAPVRARRGLPDAVPAAGPGRSRIPARAGAARSATGSCLPRDFGRRRRRSRPPGATSVARTCSSSRARCGSADCPARRARSVSSVRAGRWRTRTIPPGPGCWPICGGRTARRRPRCWRPWSRC